MRWRVLAFGSLGVNIVLAALWLGASRGAPGTEPAVAVGTEPEGTVRTNVLLRRLSFSWREVESADYPTYIANLRDIGCPEQTIRDIIIADVNALYARRRAMEVVTPDQQWWRSEPDTNVLRAAVEKVRALEQERQTLLASLLGPNWESGDMINLPRPSRPGIALDGPVLGALPAETKQSLQDISLRSQEKVQAYLEAQRQLGKEADPVALAKLRQQTREELARVLAPAQLEEFLLRFSQYATDLRAEFGQLRFFNPSPEEFRAVFRATDALDQRIALLADATDANSELARKNLEGQKENAIKLALGPKRYEEYRMLQDPLYREAVAAAREAGTPDAVRALYAVNQAAAAEQDSILSNTNLTAEQREILLQSLQLDQLKAGTIAKGQELPPEPPPAPPPRRTYTVRQGDSAAVIGMIYGVPESAIRAANPNVNFSRLRPGQSINIPRNALTPTTAPLITPNIPTVPPAGQ